MAKIIQLSDDRFDSAVKENPLVLVDFWAEWCGPCRMIAPLLEEIAREKDKLVIGKLNIDDNPAKAAEFQVMAIPTLILFKDGKPVTRIIGAMPKDALLKKLEGHL